MVFLISLLSVFLWGQATQVTFDSQTVYRPGDKLLINIQTNSPLNRGSFNFGGHALGQRPTSASARTLSFDYTVPEYANSDRPQVQAIVYDDMG